LQAKAWYKQPWFVPVVLCVVLGVSILLSDRPVQGPNGAELINNMGHYNQVLKETNELIREPFAKADAGEDLTGEDKEALNKAIRNFDSLNRFEPTRVGPYLGAGKALALLGEYEAAELALRQTLNNIPIYENNDLGKQSATEAKYVLAQVRFGQGKYDEALELIDEAVKEAPNVPNYLVQRASILVQLSRPEDAMRDLDAALMLDVDNRKAKQLKRFLTNMSAPKLSD
jgi:tetratricopeptide (TPR) repeat protein